MDPTQDSKDELKNRKGDEKKEVLEEVGNKPAPIKEAIGVTPKGERFTVPETYDVVETLGSLKKWKELPVMINIILIACYFLSLFLPLPGWFYLSMFIFWRFMYNFGLGYLLHMQSNYNWFTLKFTELMKDESFRKRFEGNVSMKSDHKYEMDKFPIEYGAWLAYRIVVDIILSSDFFCYVVFVLAYWEKPETFGLWDIFLYFCGIVLCLFNFWAKSDALRVLGDYAWYWGDFFFLLDGDLVFDGIFQMFPHPMYTVGYSFYYGCSLLTRSYTVLYVSFAAHMLQLTFLTIVENPHISKTYGSMTQSDESRDKVLGSYFNEKLDGGFDPFRAHDFFLIVLTVYMVGVSWYVQTWYFHVIQVIFWRLFHTVGLGAILRLQSKSEYWTKRFIQRGYTKFDAFESWKRLFGMSLYMNHLVFLLFAIKMFTVISFDARFFLAQFCGLCLIALNVWGSIECHEVLGEFGWYYGDFFIDEIPSKLYYNGIYRYLNNPELVLGFAGYYGLGVMSGSVSVIVMAAFCQVCFFAFGRFVEKPHMLELYGETNIRKEGGIATEIRKNLKKVTYEKMKEKVIELRDDLTDKVNELKESLEGLQKNVSTKEGRAKLAEEMKKAGGDMMSKLKEKLN